MTCTASDMKTLRDCLFRAKKSDKTNTDPRAGAPDWATWELHEGVTGGWKKYPVVIYVKGIIDCSQNDSGVAMTQALYEAGDPLCGTETGAGCQQAVIQAKVERGDISVIGIPGDGGRPTDRPGGPVVSADQSIDSDGRLHSGRERRGRNPDRESPANPTCLHWSLLDGTG